MEPSQPEAHASEDSAENGPPGAEPTEASGDPIYRPVPGEIQLTVRAVVIGCLLGGLVSAMNIYFGLRTGWSIGGSLIAAILGYAVFALFPWRRPSSVLETNIVQTTGSAAGTMTSAAGLLAAIPAMRMLGYELGYFQLTLWAISVAYLGVFFAVPLRRQMVVEEKLRFPTGTATAETILAMFSTQGSETVETDINPVGGMGKVTQLVFGGLAPGQIGTNLMAAAISGAGASQAADMMQDLKTGHLLRASPRRQLIAQLVGIPAGVLFCVPIYMLFDRVYEIGGNEIPAPAAHAWRAMAELLAEGFEALPPMADRAVIAGLVFGLLTALLRKHKRIGRFMPSGLAFGIAFIIQAYYAIAMFVGSMILVVWQRRAAAHAERFAFPVASGLIAGEGLMGVVIAILTLFGARALT